MQLDGIGMEWAPLWISGLVIFTIGILALSRQKQRNALIRAP